METGFNPWRQWLGITEELGVVDYYALLGLPRYEASATRIRHAADTILTRVRSIRPGEHTEEWTAVLDALRHVRRVLTDAETKSRYDTLLASRPTAAMLDSLWQQVCRRMSAGPSTSTERENTKTVTPGSCDDGERASKADGDVNTSVIDPAMAPYVPDFRPLPSRPDPTAPAPWVAAPAAGAVPTPLASPPLGAVPGAAGPVTAAAHPLAVPVSHSGTAAAMPLAPAVGGLVASGVSPQVPLQPAGPGPAQALGGLSAGPATAIAGPTPVTASLAPVTAASAPAGRRTSVRSNQSVVPAVSLYAAGVITGVLVTWVAMNVLRRGEGPTERPTAPNTLAQQGHTRLSNGTEGRSQTSLPASAGRERSGTNTPQDTTEPSAPSDSHQGKSPAREDSVASTGPGPANHSDGAIANPSDVVVTTEGPSMPKEAPGGPAGRTSNSAPNQPDAAKLPSSADMPMPTVPATPPSAEERKALAEALLAAREAFVRLDFAEGNKRLAEAEPLARLPEHRAMMDRLALLATYLEGYQQAVSRALKKLNAGDSLSISDTTVIAIVERKPEELTVRVAGRNVTYPLNQLPLRLGLALVDQGMEAGPKALAVKAAFQATHARATPDLKEEARRWWMEASQQGEPTAELGLILDDDYSAIAQ